MSTAEKSDARLNFRLPNEFKQTIEQAAALTGQTVSDFAISTLVDNARQLIEKHDRTMLTNRDRDMFLALLDDVDAQPNPALAKAARLHNEREK